MKVKNTLAYSFIFLKILMFLVVQIQAIAMDLAVVCQLMISAAVKTVGCMEWPVNFVSQDDSAASLVWVLLQESRSSKLRYIFMILFVRFNSAISFLGA